MEVVVPHHTSQSTAEPQPTADRHVIALIRQNIERVICEHRPDPDELFELSITHNVPASRTYNTFDRTDPHRLFTQAIKLDPKNRRMVVEETFNTPGAEGSRSAFTRFLVLDYATPAQAAMLLEALQQH